MSFESEINAFFVKTRLNKLDTEDFKTAANILRTHIPENAIRHITASEGYPLIASGGLTKRDVFIFDYFEGDFFKQLQLTKSLIVGPRCLLSCLLNNQPIPWGKSPVYTTAMRDLKISASGITPQEKEELSIKIQWMGGYYLQNFGRCVTHLISNTIKSSKYEHATLNSIPVMHINWIQSVWERSLVDNICATDEEFEKYRLPIFFDANITSTGLSNAKKDEIMRLVQENGGSYHRAFRSQLVDIVITEKGKTDSEKYKAAQRLKKDILTTDWIFDSVQRGFALPIKNYQVKLLKVSTPTKTDQSIADFTSTDQTQLSEISRIATPTAASKAINDVTVNETQQLRNETFQAPLPPKAAKNKNIDSNHCDFQYRSILEKISPREAKMAGNFLDGCCIFLTGFSSEEKEKLNRILNLGGAIRYDAINNEITHVIIGQATNVDFKAWIKDGFRKSAHIVRLDWLGDSIKLRQTANEQKYRVTLPNLPNLPDAPSPSSKKTLKSMNNSFKNFNMPSKKKLFQTAKEAKTNYNNSNEMSIEEEEKQTFLAKYSQENSTAVVSFLPPPPSNTKPNSPQEPVQTIAVSVGGPNTELSCCSIDYENLNVFQNLIIYVDKNYFHEELYMQMLRECEAAHANVVSESFKDPVDYAIVTFERSYAVNELPINARFIVNELYVESCMKENRLIPIEYFHKPIPHTADAQPLKGIIIVISIYAELEREYIASLANLLGAKVNDVYSKKEQPLLVCPEPSGAKYLGALKWRFPVVTSSWLVQCAEKGIKLPLREFLVGESAEDFPPLSATHVNRQDENNTAISHVTPLRNKRVSELANAITKNNTPQTNKNVNTNNDKDSPHTPPGYGRATYSFEFMEKLLNDIEDETDRKFVRQMIDDIRANPTPELERIKRQVCTPMNLRRLSSSPKGITDYCSTPEFKRRMAEELDRLWHLPTKKLKPSTPIDQICKRVVRDTCKNLGIPVSSDEDDDQMLAATQKKNMKNKQEEVQNQATPLQRKSDSKSKTEPRSIFADVTPNMKRRSAEDDHSIISNTQDVAKIENENANKNHNKSTSNSIGMTSYASNMRSSTVGRSTIHFNKISFEESGDDFTSKGLTNNVLPELKQITDYLKERESKRQSLRNEANIIARDDNSNQLDMETEGHFVQPFESEQICPDSEQMVGWHDPIDFNNEKLAKKIPTIQYRGTPRFSISCADEVRDEIINKIHRLGGEVSTNLMNFDPACTHFLCDHPNRGEKILGCISSGKWVLSLKYIEECHAKDKFVDEELYEWGNSKAINLPSISPDEAKMAKAAYTWRKKLAGAEIPNAGLFQKFCVILNIGAKSLNSLKNVIEAGKGIVLQVETPFCKSPTARTATHCFVDTKKTPLKREDFKYLQEHGVQIVSYLYIQAFILDGEEADISLYQIKM